MSRSAPPFPLDLTRFAPADAVAALTPSERGILMELLRVAWQSEPPCTLPADDELLARIAGLTADAWQNCAVRRMMEPACEGRVWIPHAAGRYDDHARISRARAEAGSRGGRSRSATDGAASTAGRIGPAARSGPQAIAKQLLSKCSAIASAPSLRSESERSQRPERSIPLSASSLSAQSALSAAESARTGLSAGSAEGAEEPIAVIDGRGVQLVQSITTIRRLWERECIAWVKAMLGSESWAWVGTDPRNPSALDSRTPWQRELIDRITAGPHSTPRRVAFVLHRIRQTRPRRPVGMLISLLGLSDDARPPVEIDDLFFCHAFDRREADRWQAFVARNALAAHLIAHGHERDLERVWKTAGGRG